MRKLKVVVFNQYYNFSEYKVLIYENGIKRTVFKSVKQYLNTVEIQQVIV
jgi:hypothetical protein